jgi:nitrogen fixation/metabolism regulation signal transduction histidine kinase
MKIRTKIILIFICISILPLVLAGAAGFYQINKISSAALEITSESLREQTELTVDQQVKKISSAVAMYVDKINQSEDYKALQYNPDFTNLVIQVIGETGYTFLLSDESDKGKIFMHPNPRFLNKTIDVLNVKGIQKKFANVVESGNDFRGYINDRYFFIRHIQDLPFYMVAVVPNTDINKSVEKLEDRLTSARQTFLYQYNIGGLAFVVLIFLLALLFAIRLVRPIAELTNVAEKISMGDLKTSIDINSSDEIGELADALRRMQASLLKAVQRLQRRT